MALNFNVEPYYDDFDPNKNFHRILFKPGVAVQARELSQAQTILQDQISKFASSIFSQNTPVSGGKITTNLGCEHIKLNTVFNDSVVIASTFLNKTIVDPTGTIFAKVIATSEATIVSGVVTEYPTLIITYASGVKFGDNIQINTVDSTNYTAKTIGSTGGTSCQGVSSVASISEGVFYVVNGSNISNIPNADGTFSKYSIGNFVSVQPQTVILNKYDNKPSYRVGLEITETTYDYVDDPSLLDPALGSSNYQAPGADRYVIKLVLSTLPLSAGDDSNFIELLRIENGIVKKQVDSTVYSTIDDYFAKRTFDTNGDYIVSPFTLTSSVNANPNKFDLNIGKGVAYVRGYRLENQSTLTIECDRARESNTINNENISIAYGSYLYANSLMGASGDSFFDFTKISVVDFHTTKSFDSSTLAKYKTTLAATAKLRNLTYSSYKNINDANTYVYKAYICDIETKSIATNCAPGSTTTTVNLYDPGGLFSETNDVYSGVSVTIGYDTPRKIVNYTAIGTQITLDAPLTVTPTETTKVTFNFEIKDFEKMAYRSGPLSTTILATGLISEQSRSQLLPTLGDVILSDNESPELIFRIGNPYVKNITDTAYSSSNIFRGKQFVSDGGSNLTCSITFDTNDINVLAFKGTVGSNLSVDEILSYYTIVITNPNPGGTPGDNPTLIDGRILEFAGIASRTATITPDRNTITFTINTTTDTINAPFNVNIIAKVSVAADISSNHILKTKNLITADQSVVTNDAGASVSGNPNVFLNLPKGQIYIKNAGLVSPSYDQSLYIPDVKKIVKIIDTKSPSTAPTTSMLIDSTYDITTNFDFFTGQTDNFYDHSYLKLKQGAQKPIGNILVLVDYYEHGGGDGYFCVDSYLNETYAEIPNYVSTSGSFYPLRDCLDFRPARLSDTTDLLYRYTVPTADDAGLYIPDDISEVIADYNFYYGRKDILTLSKDKIFSIVKGVSSLNPVEPQLPDGSMLIAKLSLSPYTAYIPGENPTGVLANLSVEPIQHKRWTMQDISNLQTRVNNIEYYTALSLLEQKTATMSTPDTNGLNRFKNGILVDDFSSFATADTSNNDWRASINKRLRQLTPSQKVSNFPLQNPAVVKSLRTLPADYNSDYRVSSVGGTSNFFSLPYTKLSVINQQLASNTINLNPFAVAINQGVMKLTPPMDNWVDNTKAPDLVITDPNLHIYQQTDDINLLSESDWKAIPGTPITSKTSQVVTKTKVKNHGKYKDGPFGSQVGWVQTDTVTTTQTFGTAQHTQTLGYYQALDNTYSINNNFITDVSISPYIRSQEILINAKGLVINSPVTVTFDGTDISSYLYSPATITIHNATGKFNEGDVLHVDINGSTDTGIDPIGTVTSVVSLPDEIIDGILHTNRVRLGLSGVYHSTFFNAELGGLTEAPYVISSYRYNDTGTLITPWIAHGLAESNTVISPVSSSGTITSAGGSYQDITGTTVEFRKCNGGHKSSFAKAFGIWDITKNSLALPIESTAPYRGSNTAFTVQASGNYYLRWSATKGLNGFIKVNGTVVVGGGSNPSYTALKNSGSINLNAFELGNDVTVPLTAGENYVEFYAFDTVTTAKSWKNNFIAIAIADVPFKGTPSTTNYNISAKLSSKEGTIVFRTDTIRGQNNPAGITSKVALPGGGDYYTGVTKLTLNDFASDIDNFYKTCKINLTSTYVLLKYTTGKEKVYTKQTKQWTATITNYNGATRTCTLDTPVEISFGPNSFINEDLTSSYNIIGTHKNYKLAVQDGAGVPMLSTDETGSFSAIFRVPDATFRTGDRILRVDNRPIFAEPQNATSFAESTFTASGLSTKSQSISFGPSIDGAAHTFTRTETKTNQLLSTSVKTKTKFNPYDPVSQTFMIDKTENPNGVFLESIDIFFATKDTEVAHPVTLSILGTENGYPNGKTLDHSIVVVDAADIKVSKKPNFANTSTATNFKFGAPVYVEPGVLYAVLLKCQSTEYNVFVAAQNSIAIPSTVNDETTITKIGNVPGFGGLFESNNGMTWTADQSRTLMMNIYRCSFDITKSPSIPFIIPTNLPTRKSSSSDVLERVLPEYTPSSSSFTTSSNVSVHAINVSTTDFIPTGTNIDYTYKATLNSTKGYSPTYPITPGKFGCPAAEEIYLNDGKGIRVLLKDSDDDFIMYAKLSSDQEQLSPIISDDGTSLYNIEYVINNLELSNNQIHIVSGGSGYGTANTVTISAPDVVGGVQALASPIMNGDSLAGIIFNNPGSGYLKPPTITVSTTGGALVAPVIEVYSELSPSGGNAYCRYFTKKVTMAAGNDSQDLRVFYNAYRPAGTNIYVFYKILNANDTTPFDKNDWQLMTHLGQNATIYSQTRDDIYEYETAPGVNGVADNLISYTSKNGKVYDSFIQFAIKIVMTTNDKTQIPFITEFRALALPAGTGLV